MRNGREQELTEEGYIFTGKYHSHPSAADKLKMQACRDKEKEEGNKATIVVKSGAISLYVKYSEKNMRLQKRADLESAIKHNIEAQDVLILKLHQLQTEKNNMLHDLNRGN